MLAVTGTTGKIGGATLDALLEHDLVSPRDLCILTSSSPTHEKFRSVLDQGATVLEANYDDPSSLKSAFESKKIDRLFLVSTPAISMDFDDAPHGKGREGAHFNVIDAAIAAGSVQHIFYTSLAFKDGSQAGVMRAHFRTEAYLKDLHAKGKLPAYTSLRMGLYNESWPLYLGHYNVDGDDNRSEIVVASGDGPISWTSIKDLGLATALIISATGAKLEGYTNKTLFLSQRDSVTLDGICKLIDPKKSLRIVDEKEYVRYYTEEKKMDRRMLEWWSSTYPSVSSGLCHIQDDLLETLLAEKGKTPETLQSTIDGMLQR